MSIGVLKKARRATKAPNMKQTLAESPFSSMENLVEKVAEGFVLNERLSVTESIVKYTCLMEGS